MVLTEEMNQAFQTIEETTDNLFITGKAGTGKTTFLKYIVEHTHKNLIVAASTGIAAINAGGVTLHRLFGIPFDLQGHNTPIKGRFFADKADLFQRLDTLIIDEISMVRPDVLDYVDRKLRFYRFNNLPFGGVQVVMFGDLFQLPPVIKKSEEEILRQWYRGGYFFHACCLREAGFKIIELSHVFRQHDERFVNILNRIREYELLPMDIDDLSTLRDNRQSKDYTTQSIHICSLRRDADKINEQMIGEATHMFPAKFKGEFNPKNAPCDVNLKLRIGARVMTLVNDSSQGFYNGSMGTVSEITQDKIKVLLDAGHEVIIDPYTWIDREYQINGSEIQTIEKGSCTQFPLSLGWAITIHKSQGLTFDKIVVHCPYAFAPGMLYVALSRCTSMEGIITDFFISKKAIITDNELIAFNKACRNNDNKFNLDVYRAVCRFMGYENN